MAKSKKKGAKEKKVIKKVTKVRRLVALRNIDKRKLEGWKVVPIEIDKDLKHAGIERNADLVLMEK